MACAGSAQVAGLGSLPVPPGSGLRLGRPYVLCLELTSLKVSSTDVKLALPAAKSNPQSITTDITERIVGALFQLDPKTDAEAFALIYNYLFFVVPFYAGLHITYMDKNLFLRAVGDKARVLITTPATSFAVCSTSIHSNVHTACRAQSVGDVHEEGVKCAGSFARVPPLRGRTAGHLARTVSSIIRALYPRVRRHLINLPVQALDGLLLWYALAYGGVLAFLGIVSFFIRKTHEIHVHHYLFGKPLP
jgi:hypothetical protein